jgi:hypothetical protein
MRLFARILPLASFVFSIAALGQLTVTKLPVPVTEGNAVPFTVKGKPGHNVSATASAGMIGPSATAILDAKGQAAFTVTFTGTGPQEVKVSDTTDASVAPLDFTEVDAAPAVPAKPAPVMPAGAAKSQCPLSKDPVDASLPVPVVDPVQPGASYVTGKVLDSNGKPVTGGNIQVCIDGTPAGGPKPVIDNGTFSAAPAASITANQQVTAQFTSAAGGHPGQPSTPVIVPAKPASSADPTVALEAMDQQIRASEADCTKKRDAFCLNSVNYKDFMDAVAKAVNDKVSPTKGQNWLSDYTRRQHWLVSTVYYRHDCGKPQGGVAAGQPVCTQQQTSNFAFSLPGDLTGNVTHTRIMAGIDVSAASSADPAAKFLGEFDIDIPLPGRKTTTPIGSNDWIWGYARVSSIAQASGAISSASNVSTYIQPLTSSAPSSIVQSFEVTGGYELRFRETDTHGWARRPIVISGILGGGFITPISTVQQGTPPIYIATTALQKYYATIATQNPGNTTDTTNASNISAACPAATPPATTPPTCYIAEYPSARERFFHDYGLGLRIKHYYFNDWDESFIFPAIFDVTVGQNDYVTAGYLRRAVIHLGGSTPLKQFPGLYVYAAFDLALEKNGTPNQQFVLQSAPSTVTVSSANVANIFVGQPDRDRYRFGIAYDLDSLIKKFNPPKQQ